MFFNLYSFCQDDLVIGQIEISQMKNHIDSICLSENIVGMDVAVIVQGEIKWRHHYGFANNLSKDKVDSNSIFQCASISKAMTAVGVLKLVDEGKIDLDKNVNTYLENWQIKESKLTKDSVVSVRRLLNHTAGFRTQGSWGYRQNDSLPSLIEVMTGKGKTGKIKLRNVPGTEWNYSNEGYMILQKIIEDISGETFENYMQRVLFQPLGMSNSTFKKYRLRDSIPYLVSGHIKKGKLIKGSWPLVVESAVGGLWSTTTDISRYIIEIQSIFAGEKKGVLSRGLVEEMLKPHLNSWGLGTYTRLEADGMQYFGHTGSNFGYRLMFDASYDLRQGGFVLFFNSEIEDRIFSKVYSPIMDLYGW
jgi:CubicO group peptidase (beta-lactamase class C family)